ncbi:MAG TPA: nitrilase-related carbon-nitrogen hydrolase [Nocardioidaceae bacterium]|nr:nitrilase-related carbon-nitrogen hydrolase [Nocardioidaceae bacterium]
MRITLAQVDSTLGDIDANVARAAEAIAEAVRASTDLIVFPELHLTGYSVGRVDVDLSLRPDDERLLRLAKDAGGAGLVLGFVEAGGLHTYNSAAYYRDGQLVHVHRKLYLPTYLDFEERKHFTPGTGLRAFPGGEAGKMAMLVCNDAWQPQLPFLATQDGARMLLVPTTSAQSSFPERYDSRTYWRDITSFYGRMYQLFVVFVNRVGVEGDLRFWGGSHLVDPWGNVVAGATEGTEDLVTVEVDIDDVRRRRRDIPLVKEARLGLIRREVERLLDEGGDF